MEKDKKKRAYKIGGGKKKVSDFCQEEKQEKLQSKIIQKIKSSSFQKGYTQMQLKLEDFGETPVNLCEFEYLSTKQKTLPPQEEDYFKIITEKREKRENLNKEIDEELSKVDEYKKFENEIKENTNNYEKQCFMIFKEINDELIRLEILQKQLNEIEKERKKYEMERDAKKKEYEISLQNPSNEILLCLKEIEQEEKNLLAIQKENEENKKKIPELMDILQKKEQEINEEKLKKEKQTQIRNELKEKYEIVNTIAINDNKFCHNNFFSLLTFFPYFKNVAFIWDTNLKENININQSEEIKYINNNNSMDIDMDENKIIVDEEMTRMENDIEKESINNIKYLLNQKENINSNNYNFKILKDRRTLQINLKEKYKFKKIFSTINNNYIAEPWDNLKYTSLKLSTINSYFNEFNMTAINNNYFIIYFVQNLDKTSLNNELHKLFQKLKNNDYIDKNIIIKISVITESNNIILQNSNLESKVKSQLNAITYSGHCIYGFLYEFTKTNRLNKKNIFRLYIFDYSYPLAEDMMSNINKYYAKKKRKKTGVYKKVIRGQGKQKKKQADKSLNNNNNNNNNKGKQKNNNIKKMNNINKIQIKKNGKINNNNNNKNNVGNIRKNNSFINNVSKMNNKVNNKNNNNNNNNNNRLNLSTNVVDKKIIIKSGSENKTQRKEKSSKKDANSKMKDNNNLNHISTVKFDENKIESITPKRNNSENKKSSMKKQRCTVFNDLKTFKPEHTLVIHDINSDFVITKDFKQVAKACGLLNYSGK